MFVRFGAAECAIIALLIVLLAGSLVISIRARRR
jgi:hypothetical protein